MGLRVLFVPLVLAFAAASALADIGPKPTTSGRTPGPAGDVEGIEVEMAEEEVELVLRNVDEHRDRLEVRAVFRMRNAGETATFETGFPIGPYRNYEDFAVTIDGRPVEFDIVDRSSLGGRPANRRGDRNDWWYVWDATYPGGKTSTHVVSYSVDIGRRLMSQQAGYVLHSGAGWKGPIGKAVVTFRAEDGFGLDHVWRALPATGGDRREDRIVWTFTDLEPTEEHDIRVSYSTRSVAETIAEKRIEAETSWEARRYLAFLLKGAPERAARERMTKEELAAFLDATAGLVAERKSEDGRTVLLRMDADEPRGYVEHPNALLVFVEHLSDVVTRHPESERARELLRTFVELGEAFLAGTLYAGEVPVAWAWRGGTDTPEKRARKEASDAKRSAEVAGWLERARRVLGGS